MRGPYGLDSDQNCQNCKAKGDRFFCQMSPAATTDFNAIKFSATYPGGALLFLEKQVAQGVFVLCSGQVKLSISSSGGKTLILRIAKPGEILGLMATMTGSPYEVTAETMHPCQVAFVRSSDFLTFVQKHTEAYQGVVTQLGSLYNGACEQLRTVGLSASAPEKLARLLLEWSAESRGAKLSGQIKMPLTHEEIAEFIGTTRETVTRTLSDFKSRRLVALQGSTLSISNRAGLEAIGGG